MFSAYRIGIQGSFDKSGFYFKARHDADTVHINDKTFYIDNNDNNVVSQILMFRFSDSYLNDLAINSQTLSLNSVLEMWLNIDKSNQDRPIHWDSMVAGNRLLKYLFIVDSLSSGNLKIDKHVKLSITERIIYHVDILERKKPLPINNHGLQAMHALVGVAKSGLAGLSLGHQTTLVESAFRSLFNEEGFCLENSSEYHFYSLQLLDSFISSGWYKETRLHEIFDNAKKFSNILFSSPSEAFSFGDSDRTLLRRQIQKKVIHSGEVKEGLFCKPQSGLSLSRIVKDNYYSSLILSNLYNGEFHNHHDYLSIEWFHKDIWVICDPGKFTYNKSEYKDWFISDLAHNTFSLSRLKHDHKNSNKIVSCYKGNNHALLGQIFDSNFCLTRSIEHHFEKIIINDYLYVHDIRMNKCIQSFLTIDSSFDEVVSEHTHSVCLKSREGYIVTISSGSDISLSRGSSDPISGWVAPRYGIKESAFQIIFNYPESRNIINNKTTVIISRVENVSV
ncbi:heparinase II/III domain-containing protein [Aeromonas sp. 601027]|uniref:heparinase II/III domain-containing protein n=1 Tax=Aeromonas sp. 601027 TaxID=2712036 RepID=UPI003B9F1F0E